jgi:hypothetical protein
MTSGKSRKKYLSVFRTAKKNAIESENEGQLCNTFSKLLHRLRKKRE